MHRVSPMGKVYDVLMAVGTVVRGVLEKLGHADCAYLRLNPNAFATNHMFDRRRNAHRLTFGGKMVRMHVDCSGEDTVTREMKRFGWGDKLGWSPASELACVILHEIAHLITHKEGGRKRGSVHNEHFYRVLLPLIGKHAESVTLELSELAGDYLLTERPPASPRRRERAAANERAALTRAVPFHSAAFCKGMHVRFTHRGTTYEGVITRRGSKRWTVRAMGRKYYVPERMLEPVNMLERL